MEDTTAAATTSDTGAAMATTMVAMADTTATTDMAVTATATTTTATATTLTAEVVTPMEPEDAEEDSHLSTTTMVQTEEAEEAGAALATT